MKANIGFSLNAEITGELADRLIAAENEIAALDARLEALEGQPPVEPDPDPEPGERSAVLSYRQVAHFDRWGEVEFYIEVWDLDADTATANLIYGVPKIEYIPDPDPRVQLWQTFTHEFTIPAGVGQMSVEIYCRMPLSGRTGMKLAEFSLKVDGVEVIQNPNFRGTGDWRKGDDEQFYIWEHVRAAPNRVTQGNGNGRPPSATDPGGSARWKAIEHGYNDDGALVDMADGPIEYGEWAAVRQVVEL